MKCPYCKKPLPSNFLIKAGASAMGSKVKGKAKARTSDQARAAVKARWEKYRKELKNKQ